MREWFIFYFSRFEAIKKLPKESQLEALTSIIEYAKEWKELTIEDSLANAIFIMAQPQIDANEKRYVAWKKWGRPKIKGSTKKSETSTTTHTTEVKEKTEFDKAIDGFIEMRKKIKKPLTEQWLKLIKEKLERLYPWKQDLQIKVLNNSISNSRQWVFPLKEEEEQKPKSRYNPFEDLSDLPLI